MSSPYRIAVTGGIGSGKSTVAALFSDLGAPIIDSDIIAKELSKANTPVFKKIIDEFGETFLNEHNELNRKKLRDFIFQNDDAKVALENILHPEIYKAIDAQISQINYPYCLIIVPLLLETKKTAQFDHILLIDVPEGIQIERAAYRDNTSPEQIERIISSQTSRKDRLQYADDVIDNTIGMAELKMIINNLHSRYLNLSN